METPGERFTKQLKKWLKDFSKTKFAIPTIIALSCVVYYLVIIYMALVCLANLLTPLFLLLLLWLAGVRRVKKLLLIGVIAIVFYTLILTGVITNQVQHVEQIEAESVDGSITGTLDPWFIDKNEPFSFRLTVNLTDPNMVVNDAHVHVIGVGAFSAVENNYTMTQESHDNTTWNIYIFNYTATTSKAVNVFKFWVDVNGTLVPAGEVDANDKVHFIQAPVSKDSLAVAALASLSAVQINLFNVLAPYGIIIAMIWWTRRARRMRERQVEKWQAEQAKEDAQKPKSVSKVPSLDAAMGKVEEGFVCSECGADVPADATVCPKCGEKFE